MAQYKTIVVTINGDVEGGLSELELPKVNALLEEGYHINGFYQIAVEASASSSTSRYGAIVLTYVLVKGY